MAYEVVNEAVWLYKFLMDLEVILNADKPITFYLITVEQQLIQKDRKIIEQQNNKEEVSSLLRYHTMWKNACDENFNNKEPR